MGHHSNAMIADRPLTGAETVSFVPSSGQHLSAELKAPAPGAEAAEPQRPVTSAPPKRSRWPLLAGASLLVLGAAAYLGSEYWSVWRFQVSTDDAYVQADNTTIAPKVSGYLSDVLVGDNETVKAGQVLARIDDRDFKVALDQAKADVLGAKAAVANKQASLDAQQSIIESAKATIDVDRANETFAEQDNQRFTHLATTGYGSVQNAQQATSRIAAARASVARDSASLANAIKQTDILKAELAQAQATQARDEAVQRQAELNLSYTNILSPVDGAVGNRTLRVGQYVQAGTQLMAVVPTASAYIVANFKETQLADVRPGQAVNVEVDMFPGVEIPAHVDSLAPASGQQFALLPPDNATGNFTKIVQRIPVKITLDPGNPLAGELRPGMSVYPTIETKQQSKSGTSLAAK
ncbi:HlyD family secretion protein [Hyphomicrobium sp. ghe19]|uniref:HlyD family secretion protein n=1 Tax=Hyphomicrobium sp. ghe19 TaxID=2682968 RepID=UPI0013670B2E|nr:putative multidrug resistance protein EmrK [Hyphomicrobium sp. ghe19]